MRRHLRTRSGALALLALLATVGLLAAAATSPGDLRSKQRSLQQSIASDSRQISAYRGRLRDIQARLAGIESSLAVQRALLARIQTELAASRARLAQLRAALARDRSLLAAQLVAQYESPAPNLVGVLLESRGFVDLLERVDQMKRLAEHNATVVTLVARDKRRVALESVQWAAEQTRQERVTAAVLVERDQVATLRLAVLQRERATGRDQARKRAQLRAVERQIAALEARAAAAERASLANAGQASDTGFVADGGLYGFFPAPGTNYSVGEEPEIASRLDRLGKALHLHLIGLSGYRTPEHSVEVGGFADDPHTRGEASDTPGVEGVPEQTLLQFGLTRPFPGPAEADHIQLA